MIMKITDNNQHTQAMLHEAMELLDDAFCNLGMFQRQRYGSLRKRFEQHTAIRPDLHQALNNIDVNPHVK